jgi:hypothetical protein
MMQLSCAALQTHSLSNCIRLLPLTSMQHLLTHYSTSAADGWALLLQMEPLSDRLLIKPIEEEPVSSDRRLAVGADASTPFVG